jgi:hypothetical protein
MIAKFETLPDDARIWIYQANRSLTDEELAGLEKQISAFLEEWTAHGQQLNAGFEIKYKRFIVIGLDQSQGGASGCSIDAQVRFIQQLEKQLDIDLLDKMNVSYKTGEFIAHKPLADFKKMAKNRSVSKDTIVFNNLVNTKSEYRDYWEVPAKESWHARFF